MDSPSHLPSLESGECGVGSDSAGFILGGNATDIGEFPFLALLGNISVSQSRGRTIKWGCGGSIINKWFVLSAAHCGGTVDYVRLGEWRVEENTRDTTDCQTVQGRKVCTEPYQDITVAEIKIHPDYRLTSYRLAVNDVMLLKLSSPAIYNDFVRPVCLPPPSLAQYGEPGAGLFGNNVATVVGWGR